MRELATTELVLQQLDTVANLPSPTSYKIIGSKSGVEKMSASISKGEYLGATGHLIRLLVNSDRNFLWYIYCIFESLYLRFGSLGGDICTIDIHSVINSSLDPQCVSMSRKQIKTFYQVEWLPSKNENHVERWCNLKKKYKRTNNNNKQRNTMHAILCLNNKKCRG